MCESVATEMMMSTSTSQIGFLGYCYRFAHNRNEWRDECISTQQEKLPFKSLSVRTRTHDSLSHTQTPLSGNNNIVIVACHNISTLGSFLCRTGACWRCRCCYYCEKWPMADETKRYNSLEKNWTETATIPLAMAKTSFWEHIKNFSMAPLENVPHKSCLFCLPFK